MTRVNREVVKTLALPEVQKLMQSEGGQASSRAWCCQAVASSNPAMADLIPLAAESLTRAEAAIDELW